MRIVKAEIIIDQVWLEAFLKPYQGAVVYPEIIQDTDEEQIVDILAQIYWQDLEQQ